MDSNVETLIIAAMALAMIILSSSDLALDVLHVAPGSMPGWLSGVTTTMTDRQTSEAEGTGRTIRRIADTVILVLALAAPILLLGRSGADASAITWSALLEIASLVWFLWLLRRPRRPLTRPENAAGGGAVSRGAAPRPGGKSTGKSKRRRR